MNNVNIWTDKLEHVLEGVLCGSMLRGLQPLEVRISQFESAPMMLMYSFAAGSSLGDVQAETGGTHSQLAV